MLRLWIDVLNSDGQRLGDGPIMEALSATVTRTLDGAGSVEFDVAATSRRALELVDNEREIAIWVHDGIDKREIGRGVAQEIEFAESESGATFRISGPDSMGELIDSSVLINRTFDEALLSDIATELVGLASGWTVTADADLGRWSGRMEGGSALQHLIRLAENKALHLRAGLQPQTLEFGRFGNIAAVQAIGVQNITREMHHNDSILLVSELSYKKSSKDIVNWILPLGAGEGDSTVTLADSNRHGDYPIETVTGPNGEQLYYIKHAASVAQFRREKQRVLKFDDITPIDSSAEARVNAANALYDAAVAELERRAKRQDTFSFSVKKPRTTLRPGEKLLLTYTGEVYRDGLAVRPVDIRDYFYILSTEERISSSGLSLGIEVSTVDAHAESMERKLIKTKEAVDLLKFSVAPPT